MMAIASLFNFAALTDGHCPGSTQTASRKKIFWTALRVNFSLIRRTRWTESEWEGLFHPCISFCHSNWPAVPLLGFFWFGVCLFACFPLALVVFGFLSCLSCWLFFWLPDYQFTMKPRAVHSLACVFCHDTSISHQFTIVHISCTWTASYPRDRAQPEKEKKCCVDSSSFMFSYGSAD